MRETTLKFKRGMLTAFFSTAAIWAAHPLMVLYPSPGMSAFVGGACAFAGMLLANRFMQP